MKLNLKQAYLAMFNLLDGYYWSARDDILGGMLGFMSTDIFEEDMPADSAVWSTWENCVNKITNNQSISSEEAFQSMLIFLRLYHEKFGFDLNWLFEELMNNSAHDEKWTNSVRNAIKEE